MDDYNLPHEVLSSTHLDGNVAGGALEAVFAGFTAARATCLACGLEDVVAAVRVYGAPMGLVARCNGCDTVLFSYTDLPPGRIFHMSGVAALRLPSSS